MNDKKLYALDAIGRVRTSDYTKAHDNFKSKGFNHAINSVTQDPLYTKISRVLYDWQFSLQRSLHLKTADRDKLIKMIMKLMEETTT